MELTVYRNRPVVIGATGVDALLQNIRTIVLTSQYSVPLNRGFAHLNEMIDSPSPENTARLTGELTEAIEKYEPRVKVERLVFEQAASDGMNGRMIPRITFKLRDGVTL